MCVGCHVCVEAETMWIISVASSQLSYEPETSLKYKVLTMILMTDKPIEADRRY